MSELTDLIDRMVEQKTFSLDALEAVKALKGKAETLEKRVDQLADMVDTRDRIIEQHKAERSQLQADIQIWQKRQNELEVREKAITDLEKRVAVAEARSAAQNETVGMFLRLPQVRRNISETIGHVVPSPTPGSYPMTYSTQDRTETVETHE